MKKKSSSDETSQISQVAFFYKKKTFTREISKTVRDQNTKLTDDKQLIEHVFHSCYIWLSVTSVSHSNRSNNRIFFRSLHFLKINLLSVINT